MIHKMFFNFLTKFTVGAQIMTCPKSIYRCHNLTKDFQQRFSRISHTYSEPCQTSKIELSTNKDNSFQYLTISLKKIHTRCLTDSRMWLWVSPHD